MAWHGMALHCIAWHGIAWHGIAWHGIAWHGMAGPPDPKSSGKKMAFFFSACFFFITLPRTWDGLFITQWLHFLVQPE